ncbi:WD40 repeat domain-containing protein [Nostoc sp. UCD121]|uniref:WD40 repeat domain-containing protein n=1 Tax=unclassified Nostoc TaxID=2593658 RepID=UPI0016291C75|nr:MULTISPECIES: WD40 repeat domain-containing protein [unclassified Nostoc]MBC1221571.1 WD40 repeat domain-containing protein [Nostoc sp. UCD120]MBC1279044.1 WD40 repeat domain-containing protein [Nostoc sp. UCD121]MBC1297438.1 WD40 repeat domain-containing protein [Nostoc sp. UCD122]
MQQGLMLLIQLVLEFAPVVAELVQNRNKSSLGLSKYEPIEAIPEILKVLNPANKKSGYVEDFEQARIFQQQLIADNHQTRLRIAAQERETALKLPEVNKIFDSWPLRLYPSQILDHTNYGHTPLKIFIAPPQVDFDQFGDRRNENISQIELMLAEGLRDFLNKHYSLHSQVRPTELLAGAWDSKRFHSESSIKALFGMLKTEPSLILESENDGDYLNFRIAYWGLGQDNYYYKTIARLPYREILEESAKRRALEWKKIRDELVALGEELEEINQLGKDNVINLEILEKVEKWDKKGIDISKLSLQYQVNRQDYEKLCQVLITYHCLVAGWVADIYHLVDRGVPPLLPELLPSLLSDAFDLQSLGVIASGYKQVYQALENERCYWIPELALQLAQSLCHLSDAYGGKLRSWANEQLNYSLSTWLQLRQISPNNSPNPLQEMQSAVSIKDEEYVKKLREYFVAVGDTQSIADVDEILNRIANLKYQVTLQHIFLSHTLTGHSEKVTSVAISPDSETLVSGCADKTIKVWNLKTGKLIRTLTEDLGKISSVAISPDGHYFAVGICQHPKSNVKVWNLNSDKLLHTLLGHQKPVNCIAISPDGQILASGSNKIKIWNLHKGDRISTLWHSFAVNTAAISPDGTILASGSSDNKIRLWNPHTGDPLRTLNGHSGEVKSLIISPDGEILFSASADKTIKIWHLTTGKVLNTLTGHLEEVRSLAVSPDGGILFSGSVDKTIKIWHLQTGELLQTITEHSGAVNSIAISHDGQFLASGSSDKAIKIWQIN